MKWAVLASVFLAVIHSFTFLNPSVFPSSLIINSLASYTFIAQRQFDSNLNPTPFSTQPTPANSNITIIFPIEFDFTNTTPIVTFLLINDQPIAFNFTVIGNNLTIMNAVPADSAIANLTITTDNVLNPYPALTTSPFVITIGLDSSSSSSSSSITLSPATLTACSINFSPATVNTTGSMIVAVTPTNKILANGYIQITFPSSLQWAEDVSTSHPFPLASTLTCVALSGEIISGTCLGQISTSSITFTIGSINGTTVTAPFSFSVSSLFSPPTTTAPDTLQIVTAASNNDQIDSCITTITGLQPQTLTLTLSASTTPLYINSGTSIILTFTLTDTLSKGDYFQLVFPPGTSFTFVIVVTSNLSIFSSLVTYVAANQTLVLRQAASSPTRYAGTTCRITLNRYTAPSSTLTASPFIFQVYNQQNGLKMQGTTSLTATAKTYTFSVVPTSLLINQPTSYTFNIVTTDPILSNGMIDLTFPSELTLSIVSGCVVNSNFPSPATHSCQLLTNTIRISGLSTVNIPASTYTLTVQSITNADRALTTSNFSLVVYYSNDTQAQVGINSISGVTMQPHLLNSSLITTTLSNYSVTATPITLNVTFSVANAVGTNGYIIITIPPQFVFVNNYLPQCQIKVGLVSAIPSCTLTNITTFNIPLGSLSLTPAQTVTVSFKNFATNPPTTQPTSSLSLYTYSPDNYLIDYSNTSIQIASLQTVSYFSATLIPNSFNNSLSTEYLLSVQQNIAWAINSYLLLDFPNTITTTNPTCLNSINNSTLTCTMINTTQLKIDLPFNDSSVSVSITPINNPPSLRPSSPFTISTLSSQGYPYTYDNISLTITTTTPSIFPTLTYSFSSQTYNTPTNLTLSITNTISNTDTYTFTSFSQFVNTAVANFTCSSPSFAINCVLNSGILTITPVNSTDLFALVTSIDIIDLFVPIANTTPMTLSSLEGGYLVSSDSVIWQPVCVIPCLTCDSTNKSICLSCFSDTTFTTLIYFYQQSCHASCPLGTYAPLNSLICQPCTLPCVGCSGSPTSCTECDQNSTTPILDPTNATCLSSCSSGSFADNTSNLTTTTPVCSVCISPCATCTSATVCISCSNSSLFYYNQLCITSCPVFITIANVSTMICQPCDPTCLTCSISTFTCLTCNTTIAPFFITSSSICVASCPSPLVPQTNTSCVSCQSPCLLCSLTKTNCTSCQPNSYLSQLLPNTCLSTCQQFYYPNTTSNTCELCSTVVNLNCTNCFNSTYCISCDIGFVLFTDTHACLDAVPTGFVNISSIAVACTNNCTECLGRADNCSLCSGTQGLYLFQGAGSCLDPCPSTTLILNNLCTICTSPCLSCSNTLINCSSCLTGYLYYNTTTNTSSCLNTCPAGTFINATSIVCQNCFSPCSTCQGGQSACTSCVTGYLFNFSCISVCPNNTLTNDILLVCQTCVSPCLSCSGTTNNCTSCDPAFYFYQPFARCYITCPSSISVNDTTNIVLNCLPCDPTCLTCISLTTTCISCSTGLSLFNSTCSSTCPNGYYSLAGVCQLCNSNCSTCQTISTSCSSCLNPLILYGSSCISICPVTHGFIVNNVCTSCSGGCLNCSSIDFCYQCLTTSALYLGSCVTSCPSPLLFHYNTTSNKYNCFTSTELQAQTNANTLQDSLQVSSIFPLPFTIFTSFFFLCCLMSKLQFMPTYVIGIGYSLFGTSETGALIYLIYTYSSHSLTTNYDTYYLLLWVCLAIILTLNTLSLVMITPCLCSDQQFTNWLQNRRRGTAVQQKEQQLTGFSQEIDQQKQGGDCSHKLSFTCFTIISLLTNHKLIMLMFTKLFRFGCLSAQLEDIHSFRIFNVMSVMGMLHEGLYFYTAIKLFSVFSFGSDNQVMFAVIDCLAVVVVSLIFALMATYKEQDFFRVKEQRQRIDLGRKKKNDKDPKNLKIGTNRLAGLDSRDKLVDLDDSMSSIQGDRQEVIVNHNINSQLMPKKVSSSWVERTTPIRPRPSKQPQHKNIFDLDQRDEDSGLPFEAHQPYSARQKIDLYHTSVKPAVLANRAADSRVNDWAQGDNPKKVDDSQNILDSGILSNSAILASTKMPVKMGITSSIVQIDLDGIGSQAPAKQKESDSTKDIKFTQSVVFTKSQAPKGGFASDKAAIIKETQSQNFQTSEKKSINSPNKEVQQSHINIIVAQPIKQQQKAKTQSNDLNKTVQEGHVLSDSKNKSFESVLPFVHQQGMLKEKKKKVFEERVVYPRKVAASSVPHAPKMVEQGVVANTYFLQKEDEAKKGDKEMQNLQEMLDLSEVKQKPKQLEQSLNIPKSKSKIGMTPALINQTITPQQSNLPPKQPPLPSKTVVHAPKTFSRTKLITGEVIVQDQQIQEFELKLHQKQVYLQNLKQTRNLHKQKSQKSVRKSRKSISRPIDLSKDRDGELIIQTQNNPKRTQSHFESQQLEEVELQPKGESKRPSESQQNIFDIDRESVESEQVSSPQKEVSQKNSDSHSQWSQNSDEKQQESKERSSEQQEESSRQEQKVEEQSMSSKKPSQESGPYYKDIQIQKYPEQLPKQPEPAKQYFQEFPIESQPQLAQITQNEEISSNRQSAPQEASVNQLEQKQPIVFVPEQRNNVREQLNMKKKQPEKMQNIQANYIIEQKEAQSYQEESDEGNRFEEPQAPAGRQQFIVEQEQVDLTDQQSDIKNQTVNNKPQHPQPSPSNYHNFSISTQKVNKKHKIQPQPVAQEEYRSPFVFDRKQKVGPNELPLDSDIAIQTKPISRIQSQQPKKQIPKEKDHKQIINLLNSTKNQRNSRSKNKLPKQQKQQRVIIRLDQKTNLHRSPIENTNLIRKSMQKNKPISNYPLKQQLQDYQQEDYPKQSRPSITKHQTSRQLPTKNIEKNSLLIPPKHVSALSLTSKEKNTQRVIPVVKREESPLEVREFDFGEEMSSQISGPNFNSEAELVRWKQNLQGERAERLPPTYHPNNTPNQPYIHNLSQLDQYQEDSGDQVPKPRHKSKRKRSKLRKSSQKKKSNDLQRIYGFQ